MLVSLILIGVVSVLALALAGFAALVALDVNDDLQRLLDQQVSEGKARGTVLRVEGGPGFMGRD